MKAVVAVFNQEKALVGAFSVICGTSLGDGVCVCPGLGSRVDTEREEAAGDQAHSNQSPLHTQLRLSWPPVSGTMRQHTEVRMTLDTEVRMTLGPGTA